MKLIVGKVEQYQDYDSDQTLLRVPFQIVDDEGVQLMERHQSFPLTASQEEITEVLNRSLAVFKENTERYEAIKEHQANLDAASQVADVISGLEIN